MDNITLMPTMKRTSRKRVCAWAGIIAIIIQTFMPFAPALASAVSGGKGEIASGEVICTPTGQIIVFAGGGDDTPSPFSYPSQPCEFCQVCQLVVFQHDPVSNGHDSAFGLPQISIILAQVTFENTRRGLDLAARPVRAPPPFV